VLFFAGSAVSLYSVPRKCNRSSTRRRVCDKFIYEPIGVRVERKWKAEAAWGGFSRRISVCRPLLFSSLSTCPRRVYEVRLLSGIKNEYGGMNSMSYFTVTTVVLSMRNSDVILLCQMNVLCS